MDLVTGATGLVGSHLIEKLRARGRRIRAFVRPSSDVSPLAGLEFAYGDITEAASVREAVRGVNVVYHTAARVELFGDREKLLKVNVAGTQNVVNACVAAGVKRLVFVSSVAVYGNSNKPLISEGHPLSANEPYSESKILGERLVLRAYREHELPVVILRPCVIYGPRDKNFLGRILKAMNGLPLLLVDGGEALLDLVHAADVAEALMRAAKHEKAVGQAYNITDGQAHTIREFIGLLQRITGRQLSVIHTPYFMAYGMALCLGTALKFFSPGEPPLIKPAMVQAMSYPHHFDISKARRELEYEPKIPLREGLAQALAGYREQCSYEVR